MKVLLYVEPHPIRDSFEEFSGIGTFLAEALLKEKRNTPFDLRVFSNNAVLDLICSKIPEIAMICERPNGVESKKIEDYKSAWSKKNIDTWIDLTRSEGPATELYFSILERIYKKYPFEAVLLWSENGAVRKFCESHGVVVLHGELGPTRSPFEETMYFDPAGTNGNASVRRASLDGLPLYDLPPQTWLAQRSRFENNPDGIGIVDTPYTAVPDELSQQIKFPFIYVPLQLADDLNTIKNSDFEGPSDYLQKILPAFIEQGYTVVIKPHPGSVSRPYNLIEETKALAYARTFGESVVVLDRKVTITRSLRILAQASFVCTINSSVGYEALLLGKRALIMGDAIYDVGGHLKVSLSDIQDLSKLKSDKEHITRLFNFFSGHFLIEKSSIATGKPLIEILSFLLDMKSRDIQENNELYWKSWVNRFKYGVSWLGAAAIAETEPVLDIEIQEVFGNMNLLTAETKHIALEHDRAIILAKEKGTTVAAGYAKMAPGLFFGCIDSLQASEKLKGGTTISGWAIDDSIRQIAFLMVIHNHTIITSGHTVISRLDTADFLREKLKNSASKSITNNCGFRTDVNIAPNKINECTLALISSDNTISIYKVEAGLLKPAIE